MIDTRMIAARANRAVGEKEFYKSYIKDVRLAESREVSEIWADSDAPVYERDYEFTYKGKRYLVSEKRREHFTGSYTLEEINA